DVQTGNFAGFFCGLTFSVIEICRYGNNSIGDVFAKVLFSVVLELLQHTSRDFLGGIRLVINFSIPVATHRALDRRDGALRVVHSLTLGNITGKYFATFGKGNYRRCGTRTLSVRDDCWVATF